VSFVVLSHSLYHVRTTFFNHRYALTVGSSLRIEIYIDKSPHLQCKQLHRVSHLNAIGIVLKAFLFRNSFCFLAIPDPPSKISITNTSHSSVLISWIPGFDGGAEQKFQIRYRLSTDDRYFYEDVPLGSQSFDLKNLKLGSEYHLNIRSNNSYHLSPWTDDIIIKTLNFLPLSFYHLSEFSKTKMYFTFILIIAIFGLVVFLINIILVIFFIIKRRQSNVNNENLSTTGTNETETNTVDLFQPIPSNFFLINTYKKYEDDDIKRPFVSSFSSISLSQQGKFYFSNFIYLFLII